MNQPIINKFSWHDPNGNVIFPTAWKQWLDEHNGIGFGPVVQCSWTADGVPYSIPVDQRKSSWDLLPDSSGFICIETSRWEPDNCLLLDARGNERMRLTVPWEMTGSNNALSGITPTSFAGVVEPYSNEVSTEKGIFGLKAWVEHAGMYYFELDYRAGQFLWCRRIHD